MATGLRENDPYKNMSSGQQNVRPGFLMNEKDSRWASNNDVANDLRLAEENAKDGKLMQSEDSLAGARENEEAAEGLYTGGSKDSDKKNGKGKGFLKRKGPIGLILGLILGVGGMMGGAQMFQPFSLLAQFQETFNTMHTSAKLRSDRFFNMQMDTRRVKNPIKGGVFGADTFKITKRQAARLATQGIDYDDDFEGSGIRVLKFDDGTGEIKIVAADDASVVKLNEMNLKGFDTDNIKYNAEAISFKSLYADNADFFNGYNKGSMTWRGAIANWFGGLTAKFLGSNKITRNLFKDFQQKVAEADAGNTKKVALDMIAKGAEEIEEGGMKVVGADETTESEDGNTETKRFDSADVDPDTYRADDATFSSTVAEEPTKQTTNRSSLKTEADVKTKLNDISGKVQQGANIACTVMNTLGAIGLLVTASEALQIINLTTAYFEAIDKTKAGYGDDAPLNDLANALNEKRVNTNTTLDLSKDASSYVNNDEINVTEDGIKALETNVHTSENSAMQSSGIASLYSNSAVNPYDPSVQSFNFTASIRRVAGGVGASMEAFETCALTKIAANTVSAITSAIEIAGCILGAVGAVFTFGVSSSACGPLVGKIVKGIAVSVAIGVAVAAVISAITPVVSNMLTRDLISNLGGEDLGNALTSGANMYLGNNHRYNGGSLATKDEYGKFAIMQEQVIAENAKYERQTKNPFDITSKYTFMGTLMTQMMSFLSVNSLLSAITSSGAVVSSSVIALTPTALAYDISQKLPDENEYKEICPYLASIGAVGDAYCNPYAITDVSTIDEDPLTVIDRLDGNFLDKQTENGNVIINGNSDLAKYILYCDSRTSSFGIADQNIVNSVSNWGSVDTGSAFANNAVNSAIGAVPIIGDTIDVVSNTIALNNIGYVGGESCVAGNNVSASDSPNWETAKYYQRFIEDQSLAETIGLLGDEKSAVTAFLDEYYEQNPLDNSYEGILARYSGLTKDNVIAILDVVDYYNYIAQYDATTRYAFGAPVLEDSHVILFENDNVVAENTYIILLNEISFADVRNRNFVV
ncbi:hypothetical protein IKF88_02280 [Candidatus Saccharibacteria bacterium]|nr:hypothetical protein [Candidatus Saccharibacteria bacterium]